MTAETLCARIQAARQCDSCVILSCDEAVSLCDEITTLRRSLEIQLSNKRKQSKSPAVRIETAWGIWVEVNRTRGRKEPLREAVDLSASKNIWKAIPVMNVSTNVYAPAGVAVADADPRAVEWRRLCDAFLADNDGFLLRMGHALRYLRPGKYNGPAMPNGKPLVKTPDFMIVGTPEFEERERKREAELREMREHDRRLRENA